MNPNFTSVDHYAGVSIPKTALGADLPWFAEARTEGLAALQREGFPIRRAEDWKYTNARPILRTEWQPVFAETANAVSLSTQWWMADGFDRLVFVDGAYSPALSAVGDLPGGAMVTTLRQAVVEVPERVRSLLGSQVVNQGFSALNVALLNDGAFIDLAADVVLPRPIVIVQIATGTVPDGLFALRHLISTGTHSMGTVMSLHHGASDARYLDSTAFEIQQAAGSHLSVVHLSDESPGAFHVAALKATQERDSRFDLRSFLMGGALTRFDVDAVLAAPGTEADLQGLVLGRNKQSHDHHTTIDHAAPHGTSNELFKSILDDKARGVFTGKVIVREGADKTDSQQSNPALLLSDTAIANSRPQLEIYADDVKCAHGATVGRLDQDALFYLRQRGLSERDTRHLLTWAFAHELIENVVHEGLREGVGVRVREWLGGQ